MLGKKVALDLGTSVARLFVKGEGTVFSEPAAIALSRTDESRGIGIAGLEAATGTGVRVVYPIRAGAIADPGAVDMFLGQLLGRAVGRQRIFKPDVMVSVATAMSGDDRRVILDGLSRSGTRTAYLIDVPLAAAIGAGLEVATRDGGMIVDVGAGTTDAAVLALEGTVAGAMIPVGGRDIDEAIVSAVRVAHGVEISRSAAEMVKRELGSAVPLHEERILRVWGIHAETDRWADVSSNVAGPAVAGVVDGIVDAVRRVIADVPVALVPALRRRTALLTGGGGRLRGLDRHLTAVTGIRFAVAEDPEGATLRGCAAALDNLDVLKRNFLYIR